MKFGRKREEAKLYKQWVKHGALSPEVAPKKESSREVPISREEPADWERPIDWERPMGRERPISRERRVGGEKGGRGFLLIYILLALGMLMLCVGLALVLTQGP